MFPTHQLRVSVFAGDELIGTAETGGEHELPDDVPFEFELVAYQDPAYKRVWIELQLLKDSRVVGEGITEVNGPLTWEKLSFYNTNLEVDNFGIPFAGIQIANDPGKPYVYLGFLVVTVGSGMLFRRKIRK